MSASGESPGSRPGSSTSSTTSTRGDYNLRVSIDNTHVLQQQPAAELEAAGETPSFFVVVQVADLPKQRSEVAPASYQPKFHRSAFDFAVGDVQKGSDDPSKHAVFFAIFRALKLRKGERGKGVLVGSGSIGFAPSVAAMIGGKQVTASVKLTGDGKPGGEPTATLEARLQLAPSISVSGVSGRHAAEGAVRYRLLVRCAMNLPLVGPEDDLTSARVDVALVGPPGAGSPSAGPASPASIATVCTEVVPDNRNPRWDAELHVEPSTGDPSAGHLLIRVVDTGVEGERGESEVLAARLPTRLLRVGHSYNMRLHWPAHDASLFVTLWPEATPAHDLIAAEAAPQLQRLQVEVEGFTSQVPAMWLDGAAREAAQVITPRGLRLLGDAELVVVARLLNAQAAAAAAAHHPSRADDEEGGLGAGAGGGGASPWRRWLSLPLTTLTVEEDGSLQGSAADTPLARDVRDATVMKSLEQVCAPAVCTPHQPQWHTSLTFDVGRPSDSDAVFGEGSTYPKALLQPAPAAVLLVFFRRPLPPLSPARGRGVRRRSLASAVRHADGMAAPSLCLGTCLVPLPADLPTDGSRKVIEGAPVTDITVTTELGDGGVVSSVANSENIEVKLSLRAWAQDSFETSGEDAAAAARAARQVQQQLAAREGEDAEAMQSPRLPTSFVVQAPPSHTPSPAESVAGDNAAAGAGAGAEGPANAWGNGSDDGSLSGRGSDRQSHVTLLTVTPPPDGEANPALLEQIENANRIIKRLKQEVDRRTKAIHACGDEIKRLRQRNKILVHRAKDLHQAMTTERAGREKEERSLTDAALNAAMFNTDPGDQEALLRRIKLLARKYIAEKRSNSKLMKQLDTAKKASMGEENAQAKYDKLIKAHTTQNAIVQKLQEELAEMGVLKETVKAQERVIAKLEDVMESRADAPVNPRQRHFRVASGGELAQQPTQPSSRASSRRSRRSEGSRPGTGEGEAEGEGEDDDEEEEEVKDGAAEGEDGESVPDEEIMEGEIDPMDGHGKEMTCTIRAWNKAMSRLKARELRVGVLEEHLVTSAKAFASEAAQLKVKLMEYEMGMHDSDSDGSGGSGSDDDDDDASVKLSDSDSDGDGAGSGSGSDDGEAKLDRTDSFSRPMIKQPAMHPSGSMRKRQPGPLSPIG